MCLISDFLCYILTLRISDQPLKWSSQCRYLGVLIDYHLRWGAHCCNIVQKGSHVLNLLRQSYLATRRMLNL